MDINVLQELINTMGFPIVMVGYFIWDKTKVTNTLVKAIQDNTIVMNRLLSLILQVMKRLLLCVHVVQ